MGRAEAKSERTRWFRVPQKCIDVRKASATHNETWIQFRATQIKCAWIRQSGLVKLEFVSKTCRFEATRIRGAQLDQKEHRAIRLKAGLAGARLGWARLGWIDWLGSLAGLGWLAG